MTVPFVRTLILYCAVILAVRLMGKRQVGELDPPELVITILISDLAAIPMQDLGIPLFAGIVPIVTLIAVEILMSYFSLNNRRFRRALDGHPAIIIRKGQLDIEKMREMRLTVEEVVESLRKLSVWSISDVKYCVVEPDGQLSVVLKQPQQPVTAEMLGLTPKDTGLPLIVVAEGKFVQRSLEMLGQTEEHVLQRIKAKGYGLHQIFLMTLDDCGNTFIQIKEGV